jgi:hypothetical protein
MRKRFSFAGSFYRYCNTNYCAPKIYLFSDGKDSFSRSFCADGASFCSLTNASSITMTVAALHNSIIFRSTSSVIHMTMVLFNLLMLLLLMLVSTDAFTVTLIGRQRGHQSIRSCTKGQNIIRSTEKNHGSLFPLFYSDDDENERQRIGMTSRLLKDAGSSFRNMQGKTDDLLEKQPFMALAIFLVVGLIAAYISGFAILGGYMSSANPAENGAIPYWDDELPPML